jgi:hypothetical protein
MLLFMRLVSLGNNPQRLQLGEVAVFKALTFNLELNFF